MPRFLKTSIFRDPEPGESGGGTTPPPAPTAPPQSFSAEYVKELREENKAWRQKHQATEQERDSFKTAAEKAAAEAKELTSAAQAAADQRVIRAELKAAALKAGMVDLDGLKLADLSAVKLNDSGEVEGAEALMDALKKSKPYLFASTQHSTTPGTPPASTPPVAKSAKDMTPEEYAIARAKLKNK